MSWDCDWFWTGWDDGAAGPGGYTVEPTSDTRFEMDYATTYRFDVAIKNDFPLDERFYVVQALPSTTAFARYVSQYPPYVDVPAGSSITFPVLQSDNLTSHASPMLFVVQPSREPTNRAGFTVGATWQQPWAGGNTQALTPQSNALWLHGTSSQVWMTAYNVTTVGEPLLPPWGPVPFQTGSIGWMGSADLEWGMQFDPGSPMHSQLTIQSAVPTVSVVETRLEVWDYNTGRPERVIAQGSAGPFVWTAGERKTIDVPATLVTDETVYPGGNRALHYLAWLQGTAAPVGDVHWLVQNRSHIRLGLQPYHDEVDYSVVDAPLPRLGTGGGCGTRETDGNGLFFSEVLLRNLGLNSDSFDITIRADDRLNATVSPQRVKLDPESQVSLVAQFQAKPGTEPGLYAVTIDAASTTDPANHMAYRIPVQIVAEWSPDETPFGSPAVDSPIAVAPSVVLLILGAALVWRTRR